MNNSEDRKFWLEIRHTCLDMVRFYFQLYKERGDQKYLERARPFGELSKTAKAALNSLS